MYKNYSKLYSKWCDCYDPYGTEISIIKKYCSFDNKDILDIGCGTGRFMFRVLTMAKSIVGIDNDKESIDVLKQILKEKYTQYISKSKVYCCNIEDFPVVNDSIDLALFTWSFYALNKEQMVCSLNNIYSMLRNNGKLIILQPIGGDFEEVMRLFFNEHNDMDEYNNCLDIMNSVTSKNFTQIATDKIVSEFVLDDLNMFADSLKMFAITEGSCNKKEIEYITPQYIKPIIEKYRIDKTYHFSDEVSVFIFEKKRVI